jgi:pseudo-rSAM protein
LPEESQRFWFVLDNYVHVSVEGKSVMFYNPLNGMILEYPDCEPVSKLVKRLHWPKNLLVVSLTGKELSHPDISRFVREIRSSFMGDLIPASRTRGKPLQMMPYLNVQQDVEYIKKKSPGAITVGEQMMKYLVEISIYINSACTLDCDRRLCGSAYRQFLCCTRGSGRGEELDILSIEHFLQQLPGTSLARMNILGGDIFKFPQWNRLMAILNEPALSVEKNFYAHYLNLLHQEKKLTMFRTGSFSLKIVVPFPIKKRQWEQLMDILSIYRPDYHLVFIITGESDITEAEELISLYPLDKYSLHPFFNGENREFFQDTVFFDKEDLREARPTLTEILARQSINPFHFGALTVLSNGHIHANVNVSRLGNLEKDSIYDVVYKEMDRGISWRRTRKKVEPCRHCTFKGLCPPLSNYEYALGQNNPCNI